MNADTLSRSIRLPWRNPKSQLRSHREQHRHLTQWMPFLTRLPASVKGHLVAVAGEFVGTFLFMLFGEGGINVVNTAPTVGSNALPLNANPAKLLYIALCFGMSLAVNAWVFFRISGGLFNPAVTVGMMLIGNIDYIRGLLIAVAQLIGGIAAAAVVSGLTPGPLVVSTTLGPNTSIVQGLFIEMFLTAGLVLTIFMLAAERHEANFVAPVGIGLALFIAHLFGIYYTGAALNPARAFGPAVVTGHFEGYHWIYWIGPLLGALLAAVFYVFVKSLEYETINMKEHERDRGLGEKDGCPDDLSPSETDDKPELRDRLHSRVSGQTVVGTSNVFPAARDLEEGRV